ncbi:MAG: hypothetical protein G01um101448_313 [Parcubacteria group bacterium Gr01-1014_48]|nr:MAG: hypothetical protein Greene041614_485 [Parcubacteria group bacterium Greene0416_14]TSC74150.1 MAG: hypothetical protein G01um101448_313 [Parcubacteria group bacterium Gr01-1014_48]TSD01693.1 MAG: hypothetical protein Greene101415_91 [Parcubacteria group bacterium Greene1014_15]TSD08173.1 MAG: hypothetical protein Greene07144_355 [Parcubacteria group bacterium Greene0714_4]
MAVFTQEFSISTSLKNKLKIVHVILPIEIRQEVLHLRDECNKINARTAIINRIVQFFTVDASKAKLIRATDCDQSGDISLTHIVPQSIQSCAIDIHDIELQDTLLRGRRRVRIKLRSMIEKCHTYTERPRIAFRHKIQNFQHLHHRGIDSEIRHILSPFSRSLLVKA